MSRIMKSLIKSAYYGTVCNTQIRSYSRWVHRRPQRVMMPEQFEKQHTNKVTETNRYEEEVVDLSSHNLKKVYKKSKISESAKLINIAELEEKTNYIDYNITPVPKKEKVHVKSKQQLKVQTTDVLETVIDAEGNFIYTKLKDNDCKIGKLMVEVKSRNQQVKKQLALLEGKRLIRDALVSGCKLETLLFSRTSDVEYLKDVLPKLGAKIYKIPYKEIQMWSPLTTTPGIMGVFKTPTIENFTPPDNSLPLTIVCDNVREPGNLGAILRTAAAVGCQRVILTKGCVDLWDTKVLRSACGAHFHLQIHIKQNIQVVTKELEKDSQIFIADNKIITSVEEADESCDALSLQNVINEIPILPYYGINFKTIKSIVLVIGGETNGISEESYRVAYERKGVRLNVPLNQNIESLNTGTALGIIAFEIKRQLNIL